MNTGKNPLKQAYTDSINLTSPISRQAYRRKMGLFSMMAICAAVFLSAIFPAQAQAEESAAYFSLSNHLSAPPAFNPETAEAEVQPDCTVPDNIRAHPLVCSGGNAPVTRSASAKNAYLLNPDTGYPSLSAAGSKKVRQAITAQKNENEWKMGVELRSSPVVEAHGNANRHESAGGIIKGNMKF